MCRPIDSPFPPERLHELYCQQEKSLAEIARLSMPLLGMTRPVSQPTVTRWLQQAGVPLRSVAEACRVRFRLHPEQHGHGDTPRTREERSCAWCGKVLSRLPCKMRGARVYCAVACQVRWHAQERARRQIEELAKELAG